MKGQRIKYTAIDELPDTAQPISKYAKERGITVAYVYKLYKQGKILIVDFKGINFVIN